jgi:hypothetical protein
MAPGKNMVGYEKGINCQGPQKQVVTFSVQIGEDEAFIRFRMAK